MMDVESLSRLAFASLQSFSLGAATGWFLLYQQRRLDARYHTFTLILFCLCSLRWGKRVVSELFAIQGNVPNLKKSFDVTFFFLQILMWVTGQEIFRVRKDPAHRCGDGLITFIHGALLATLISTAVHELRRSRG